MLSAIQLMLTCIFLLLGQGWSHAQTGRLIKEVPILCYHNIVENIGKHSPAYTCSVSTFTEHLKALAKNGFHSVSPDQVYEYLMGRAVLPLKPFMITFDDAKQEHFEIAANLLQEFRFTGVFFVPTKYLNKKNFLSKHQVQQLSVDGHTIGAHSYDHPNLSKIDISDWNNQVTQPKKELELVTATKIEYFAYPFGIWNDSIIKHLRQAGFKAAFQLGGKKSQESPIYTIRRLMVSGNWTARKLIKEMNGISLNNQSIEMILDLNGIQNR